MGVPSSFGPNSKGLSQFVQAYFIDSNLITFRDDGRMIYPSLGSLGDSSYDVMVAAFAARAIDPADFAEVRPGRPVPDPVTCLKIQCGAITQEEAGLDLLADCSFGGFAGAMSCASPLCAPYCGNTAAAVSRAAQPLPVAPRVARMVVDVPQRLNLPGRGCESIFYGAKFGGPYDDSTPCGCGIQGFIADHPIMAVAILGAAAYGIYRWRARG